MGLNISNEQTTIIESYVVLVLFLKVFLLEIVNILFHFNQCFSPMGKKSVSSTGKCTLTVLSHSVNSVNDEILI